MDEIAQIIMDEEEEIKNSLDKLDLDKDKEMPLEAIPDIDDIPGIDDEDDQVVEEDDPASITMTSQSTQHGTNTLSFSGYSCSCYDEYRR